MIRLLFERSFPNFYDQNPKELVISLLKEEGSIDPKNIDQSTMDDLSSIIILAKQIIRQLKTVFHNGLGVDFYRHSETFLWKPYTHVRTAEYSITCEHVPFTIEADLGEDLPISSQIIPSLKKAFSSIRSKYSSKLGNLQVIRVSSDEVPMDKDKEWIDIHLSGILGTVKGIPIISKDQKENKDIRIEFWLNSEVTWSLPGGKKLERQLAHQEYDYDVDEDDYDEDEYEGPYYEYEGPGEAEYYFRKGEHLGERFLPGDEVPLDTTVRCELSVDIDIVLTLK